MTAALGLRALGVDVTVLSDEPEERVRPGSRALYVHHESLRTLERVHPGLGLTVAQRGIQWSGLRTHYNSRLVYAKDFAAKGRATGLPPYTSLRQIDTESHLLAACREAGAVFEWSAQVTTVTSGEDAVEVATADGRRWRASYVVGADGSRSTIRSAIGRTMLGGRSEAYHVVIDLADDPQRQDPTQRAFHYHHPGMEGRHVLVVPFAGGRQVDVQCRPDEDPDALLTDEALAQWLPRVVDFSYLDRILWRSRYPFLQHVADSFVDDSRRVLLAGEAAHLFAPFGARGMNSAIADADAAATAIGTALTATSTARARSAVEDYDRLRRTAALHNRDAAATALSHMRPSGWAAKARLRAAGQGARIVPSLGRWLEKAPYGPRTPATSLSVY